jgi:hypothetical protein
MLSQHVQKTGAQVEVSASVKCFLRRPSEDFVVGDTDCFNFTELFFSLVNVTNVRRTFSIFSNNLHLAKSVMHKPLASEGFVEHVEKGLLSLTASLVIKVRNGLFLEDRPGRGV